MRDDDDVGVVGGVAAAEHVTALQTPSASVPSRTGMPCRVRMKPTGPLPLPRARMLRHAYAVSFGSPGRTTDEIRDRPQRREVLDRLVGGAVLAEADRVVRPDVDGVDVHQRRQPHRRAHVVGELQEGAAERAGRAVQHDAGQDRAHGVLTDAEVQHPAVPVAP